MPKHKKHTKLPNGYGNISYLGKNRRRPYGVYPPATKRIQGRTIRPKAIAYCETYEEARETLAMYHKGLVLPDIHIVPKSGPTFAEVYERYYKDKYENGAKVYSKSSRQSSATAFQNAAVLHDRDFCSITYPELQAVIDNCPLKHASLELIVSLFKGMYRYAEKYELVEKDQSRHLEIRVPDDDEHGVPFSDEELFTLARHANDLTAKQLLVMIFSGFRISAFLSLDIHLAPEWYFQGGVKTAAGKNRIVPIHTAIRPVVENILKEQPRIIDTAAETFRKQMHQKLPLWGISDHTPHDCRHTFSMLCERYEVPEADRKRLLGHSFGADITNGIYGHRTVEELRASIEKIQIPGFAL